MSTSAWRGARTVLLGLGLVTLGASWPAGLSAQELDVDVSEIGYVLGDATAPVAVVEFGDFACGACAEFWRDTWPQVHAAFIETGRVSWRHVPFLLGFDRGDDGANAAECAADQGQFWAMHDRLFQEQSEWTRERRHEEILLRYATEIGLDSDEFDECYDDERGEDRTEDATRAARRAGVRGTPTFYVNGVPALGALSFEQFTAVVEEAERAARGL
jgi:protein-disulfide isomerase